MINNLFDYAAALSEKEIKKIKQERFRQEEQKKAEMVTSKFLEENPEINLDDVISYIKSTRLSTTFCAKQLGISPKAFLRLRKKYNINPISTIKNDKKSKNFASYIPSKAVKNFYNKYQLAKIPQFEIDLVQKHAAQSLKLPNKVKWVPRGRTSKGKLKPRIDCLTKYGIIVNYDHQTDNYCVFKDQKMTMMSRKEVDNLNLKFLRLKGFV